MPVYRCNLSVIHTVFRRSDSIALHFAHIWRIGFGSRKIIVIKLAPAARRSSRVLLIYAASRAAQYTRWIDWHQFRSDDGVLCALAVDLI